MARPKAFVEEEALEAALTVFWEKGYEATSTADLVTAMGIGRQSLYDTFGDKHRLYVRALRAYQQRGTDDVRHRVAGAADPIDGIIALLRGIALAPTCDRQKGCMLVNALTERSPADPTVMAIGLDSLAAHQRTFEDALARAQAAGRIPVGRDLRARARLAVIALYGLAVAGKSGADPVSLDDALDVLASALTA